MKTVPANETQMDSGEKAAPVNPATPGVAVWVAPRRCIAPEPNLRRLQGWLLAGLLGITLAVFGGVRGHEFVHFDDNVNIYNNPHIQGLTAENLRWMFTNTDYARRYMPLGWLSYAFDYQCFGLNPRAYHVGNLLAHLLNTALLFWLLKTLALRAMDPNPTPAAQRSAQWCAGVGALFWAVNPLRVETVAWASCRIYCVAFFFAILWLLAWLRSHDARTPAPRRRLFYALSAAAYGASLLTYPLAAFGPVLLVVLEIYPLRRLTTRFSEWWRPKTWPVWRDKILFVLMSGAVLGLTFHSLTQSEARFRPLTIEEFPLIERGMQAFYVWGYYAWKPWAPFQLAISYGTLHAFDPWAPRFVLSAFMVLGITATVFVMRRRWPVALALWCGHLVLLVPVLGLTEYPHSPYDRYSYLPGVLWSMALAFVLLALWRQGRRGHLAGALVMAASLLYALPAWQQVAVWRDTIPLYQHLLAGLGDQPGRSRFDHVLGIHYLRAGLTNEAIASFENAIRYESVRSDQHRYSEGVIAQSHMQLGDICAASGRTQEAFEHYQRAIESDRRLVDAVFKSGVALAKLNRPESAAKWLAEAARMDPRHIDAHRELARILEAQGDVQGTESHAETARTLEAERNRE